MHPAVTGSSPSRGLALPLATALACAVGGLSMAGDMLDGLEGPDTSWTIADTDASPKTLLHERSAERPHRGTSCERIVFDAAAGSGLRLETAVGPAALIDELRCGLWVRSSRPDVRVAVRVAMPQWISKKTGRPVETLLPGSSSRDVDRWERLEADRLPQALARQLPALRLEHGTEGSTAAALVTHLVLDVYTGPGRYDLAIDDVFLGGLVPASEVAVGHRDPQVVPAAGLTAAQPMTAAPPPLSGDPPAGLARGVLEVDGYPFFPRSLEHNGEPLATIAALGFNCVQLAEPASSGMLVEARQAGLWVICPPPPIPDVDLRDPESLPALRNWDRVLVWHLGDGLGAADVEEVAERARRVRACDLRAGRPIVAGADSGLRAVSRHLDLFVARRTVLGTSLELVDYINWLRQRPLLARPGTPFFASLATEIDPRTAAQAAALAGIGGRGLSVDPESLTMAAGAAVSAGARGILFSSSTRIDSDDPQSRRRAAAVREMNLRLKVLEPWAAAGRFAAAAPTSDPEVQAVVMEAARARAVVAWRAVQGAQVVARHYSGGDLPRDDVPLTILVPGVPEAHQAWEVAPGGLRPLRQRRVTGGVSVTLERFLTHGVVIFSGEPAVTGHMQERVRDLAPLELASARALVSIALADSADLLGRLPPPAFSGPPPVAATAMLSAANALAAEGEALAFTEPSAAIERLRRAASIAGQFRRRIWENGVRADGSMVASPLAASDTSLAEHWRFVEARNAATPGPELLVGGGMERIEDLAAAGWRHFAHPVPDVGTSVEISHTRPAAGSGCLRLLATPRDPAEPPLVVETPPVWVTTPPIAAPTGKLVEITARVRVPAAITGSVDGLLVFDSLGGPALAERVGSAPDWRRLVLQRMVPADLDVDPLSVTFALTGLGTAEIDEVSVRVLERATGEPLVVAPPVAQPAPGWRPTFPGPGDLLGPQPAPRGPTWPGRSLEWPKILPFGPPPDAPPPGPGGGTIDPFKRGRPAPSG